MTLCGHSRWHAAAISLLIGFSAGVLFGQWYARDSFHKRWKQGGVKEHMLKRFSTELRLTPEQRKQVSDIFDAKHPEMKALHDEMRPRFEALRMAAHEEIRKVLEPSQLPKFEEMNIKMRERWEQREKFFSS